MNTLNWKAALSASALALGGMAITIMKYIGKQYDTAINEVLFYGAADEETTKQVGLENLLCIYYVVVHACQTIDVCVPTLGSETIVKCLLSAQNKKGVKIRVAIHHDSKSKLETLTSRGIEVKVVRCERMAHEFILVDATDNFQEAVAVIGSVDYETSRVNCNRDCTMFASEEAVVRALKNEFNRVWESTPVFDKASKIDDL